MRRILSGLILAASAAFFVPAHAQSVALTPTPVQHFVDNNGIALSGGLLFTYAAGTTTKLATYTDASGATPNTNPIVLNSRGEANIWLSGSAYKFVLSPATDSDPPTNPIWTVDNIAGMQGAGTVADNASLAGSCTGSTGCPGGSSIFPSGVWRTDFAVGNGAPPLFFKPQTGTCASNVYPGTSTPQANDGIYCVNSADNNSWTGQLLGLVNGLQGGLTTSGDGTAAAQAALDVSFYLGLPVILPISFNFTELAVYNKARLTCGGDANLITRTADDSPGIETTTAPGFADNEAVMMHQTGQIQISNCTVYSAHRGTNFFLTAENSKYTSLHSYLQVAYGEITGTISGTTLTVVSNNQGESIVPAPAGSGGPMVICQDCGNTANSFPIITAGSGPTYTLTTSETVANSEEMALSASWSWTFTNCLAGKTCKVFYPSASVFLIGNSADNTFRDLFAGGRYLADWSACDIFSPLGIWFDSPYVEGTPGKPNHNTIEQAYFDCASLGVAINNASTEHFITTRHNNDYIGYLVGLGLVGTFGSTISQPYGDGIKRQFFGFGPKAWNNMLIGSGDGNQGVAIPIPVTSNSNAGGNLWMDPGGIGGAGWFPWWSDGGLYLTGNTPSYFQITATGSISTGSATISVPAALYNDMNGWNVVDVTAGSVNLGNILSWPQGGTTITLSANALANGTGASDVLQIEASGGAVPGGVAGVIGASTGFRIKGTYSGSTAAPTGNKAPSCGAVTNQHLEIWVSDGGTTGAKPVGNTYFAGDGTTARKVVCYGTGWVYEF